MSKIFHSAIKNHPDSGFQNQRRKLRTIIHSFYFAIKVKTDFKAKRSLFRSEVDEFGVYAMPSMITIEMTVNRRLTAGR